MPCTTLPPYEPTGFTYDSGDYPAALQQALDAVGYDELLREQAELRVHPTGKAILKIAVQTQGQGHETTFAQTRVRAPAGLDLGRPEQTEIGAAILADIVAAVSSRRTVPAPAPAVDEGIDPVCGMPVDRSRAADRAAHEGVEYVFCCAGCRRQFEAEPATVLAGAG